MLSSISWNEFAVFALSLVAAYYAAIGLLYRSELRSFIERKLNRNGQSMALQSQDDVLELEMVVNDLRYAVLDKAGINTDKEELLHELRNRLQDYQGLQRPAFRVAINNYIIQHAKEINGAAFSVEELNETWDMLLR